MVKNLSGGKTMIGQTSQDVEQILNACGPLCVISHDGKLINVNEAFTQFFHLSEDVIGLKYQDVVSEDECQIEPGQTSLLDNEISVQVYKTAVMLEKQEPVFCSVRKTPYIDPDTQMCIGTVVHFTDITCFKKTEQEQVELVEEIHKINQELTDFAYIISHDLKAPLRGIKTIADWISTDYSEQLGREGKEQLNLLINRVDRMHNLIEGVLQYSRIGRIKEALEPIDVNALIPEIGDLLACPQHIRISAQADLPSVTGEPTRIQQVFQNLIGNAVKYMDKSEGEINVSCVDNGAFWRFCVSDNGPGIESVHFEKIFRIFQTLVPRDEVESTGIGLTLVKKIIELYGGQVWVESEVGKGSTFYFTYPKEVHEDPE
jgi:PAS domain S-box-containing protein